MVCVVLLTPDTAQKLCVIEKRAFPGRQALWRADDYLAFGAQAGNAVLADDAVAAGFIAVQIAADEAEIINLGVVPDQRRHGLARNLLAAAEEHAARHGVVSMFLEVAVDNVAANALYSGAGYSQTGRRPGYYQRADGARVDALILSKSLALMRDPRRP